jgi:hypothetical protein
VRGARFHDLASVHDCDTVRYSTDDSEVMSDQDHRHVELLFKGAELV